MTTTSRAVCPNRISMEGITPRQAWQRALDGFAQARREEDAEKTANYARIVSEDEAAVARERAARLPR